MGTDKKPNLNKFIAIIGFLAFISISFIIAGNFSSSTNEPSGGTIETGDVNERINFTVNNTDASANVTLVNITLTSNTTFIANSNTTSASSNTFSNTTTVLTWDNSTVNGFVANGSSQTFAFNISVDGVNNGTVLSFNLTVRFTDDSTNSTLRNITVLDTVAPAVSSPNVNDTILHQNDSIRINITFTDTTRQAITVSGNGTGAANISMTSIGSNVFQVNTTPYSLGCNADSSCLLTFYGNDSGGNINGTATTSITIDSTNPLISYNSDTTSDSVNLSQNWIFANVSITETNFENVTFSLFNSSASVNSTSFTDSTRTINFTGLSDSSYTFNVTTYDQAGNTNNTSSRTLVLDTTEPTASISASPTSANEETTITVTCTDSDSLSGVKNRSVTITKPDSTTSSVSCNSTFTDTGGSGTYTMSYIVYDYADNSVTATNTFSISSGGGGSSSSTSSSGGSTSTPQRVFVQKTVDILIPNTNVAVSIPSQLEVSKISLNLNLAKRDISLKIIKDAVNPSKTTFFGKANKYIEIEHNIAENTINNVAIEFHVLKSWLADNNILNGNIRLYRLENNEWKELSTKIISEDSSKVNFEATSPGLSIFAVGTYVAPDVKESPKCGNNSCEPGENEVLCPVDCKIEEDIIIEEVEIKESVCGDNICEADENAETCSADCKVEDKVDEKVEEKETAYSTFIIIGVLIVVLLALFFVFKDNLKRNQKDRKRPKMQNTKL